MFGLLTQKFWHHPDAFSHFKSDLSINEIFDKQATIISRSDQSEIFSIQIDDKLYYIKRYFKTKGILSWFGCSRFKTEVKNQRWFNQMGIPSATLLAFGYEKVLFKTIRGYLITDGIMETHDLANIAANQPEFFQNKRCVQTLLSNTANILSRLHQHHFCHNDLHWRNLLINCQNNACDVFLIDCPSGHFMWGPFFKYKRLKDLANLDKVAPNFLSQTQRLRFFKYYLKINKLSNVDKVMIQHIFLHKQKRIKRKSKLNA